MSWFNKKKKSKDAKGSVDVDGPGSIDDNTSGENVSISSSDATPQIQETPLAQAPANATGMFQPQPQSNAPAAAPASAPGPSSTPNDPLMAARQKLMQISNQLRGEIIRLNEGEKGMAGHLQGIESAISDLEAKLVESEAAEAKAIAAEDYTQAEQLTAASESTKKEISAKREEINKCHATVGNATRLKVKKIQDELVTVDTMIRGFDATYQQALGAYTKYAEGLDKQTSEHDARLLSMQQVIQSRDTELEKNKDKLKEERNKVEEFVRLDSVELFAEKDDAIKQKAKLEQDIQELKEQMQRKNTELMSVSKHINEVELKVQQVRKKFLPQYQPLEAMNRSLTQEATNIENMRNQFNIAAQRVEAVKTDYADKKKENRVTVDTAKDEKDVITYLSSALHEYIQKVVDTYADIAKQLEGTLQLQYAYSGDAIQVKGITNRIQVLTVTIRDSESRIKEAESKLPDLETQKQGAISSKNYKLAGQITANIKQMQTQKDSSSVTLSSSTDELTSIRSSSADKLRELEAKKSMFHEAKRQYLYKRLYLLQDNARVCRRAVRKIEKVALGDDTYKYACGALASSLLDTVRSQLESVAKQLGETEMPPETDSDNESMDAAAASLSLAVSNATSLTSATSPTGITTATSATSPTGTTTSPTKEAMTPEKAMNIGQHVVLLIAFKNSEIDRLMSADDFEAVEKVDIQAKALEKYADSLKQFIEAGATGECPVAPACYDPKWTAPSAEGDLLG